MAPAGAGGRLLSGSSIGNFERAAAQEFLVPQTLGVGGRLFIAGSAQGASTLEAAYDDVAGVTAAFNRNALVHQAELGGDADVDALSHRAFYDEALGRIEMHLVASRSGARTGGCRHAFAEGKAHTENSYKYAPEEFEALAAAAGFDRLGHRTAKLFSVFVLEVTPEGSVLRNQPFRLQIHRPLKLVTEASDHFRW